MQSLEEIKKELPAYLEELEDYRLQQVSLLNICYTLYVLPCSLVLLGVAYFYDALPFLFLSAIAIWYFISKGVIARFKQQYQRRIKTKVFDFVLQQQAWNLSYDSEKYIDLEDFKEANLYTDYLSYKGEDLFRGKYQTSSIAFSELSVTKKIGEQVDCIFEGVFFVIDLPTTRGNLKVIDKHQRFDKSSSGNWSKVNPDLLDELVVDSSRYFKVWTEDVDTARYLLNTELLTKLKWWRQTYQGSLSLAIKKRKLYFAWSNQHHLFELNIRSSLKEVQTVSVMLEGYMQCIEVVKELVVCSKELYNGELREEEMLLINRDNTYDSLIIDE